MSSLSAKDRASLCSFTFSDGRRCRTPRTGKHPRFCFYHAQKEARARAAQKLGKDLAYFFSGDYLSACDLSAALARLIPAVVRGDLKPKTAHTVAYLAQTLMQAIHVSQHEYCEAFSSNAWRKSIRNSVNANHDYLFPPDPEPQQSEPPQPQPAQPRTQPHQPAQPRTQPQPRPAPASQSAPPPHTSLPPTSAEFVQRVVAGLQTGSLPATPHVQPAPAPPPKATPPQPAEISASCHSERSEEPAFSSSPALSPTSAHTPQTTAAHPTPSSPGCHPERSEASHPILATQPAPSAAPAAQPDNPPRTGPPTPQPAPNRDARALHSDHSGRLHIDGKPL